MKNSVIGVLFLFTTPVLGTLLGDFNFWILGHLTALNSHWQVLLIETFSYVPILLLGVKVLFAKDKVSE